MLWPIEKLDLSVRSHNCLKRAGINTVAEIIAVPSTDFMRIKNIGRKSVLEILHKIKNLGVEVNSDLLNLLEESERIWRISHPQSPM